jgi:hypothetical protein
MLGFILIIGAVALGLSFLNSRSASTAAVHDPMTVDALAAAKKALIGYAVRRGGEPTNPLARPGELPCPDTDNDGWEEVTCTTPVTTPPTFAIGRIPWRSLGIPEPKDSAGETLWYAVANPLRNRASNDNDINSNTLGNLVVRALDGVAVLTNEAVAVLLAPGQALGAQNRSASQSAACAMTGTNIPRNLCADNYLESTNGISNATRNGPFIAGVPSGTYNDRVLALTFDEYLPVVEMRVGAELRNLLLAYRQISDCQCFPWADSWAYSGGVADVGVNRGRFPRQASPEDWGATSIRGVLPALPQWVVANHWHDLIYYSAARLETDGAGVLCFYCSATPMLTVDAMPVSALLFTPGPPPPLPVNRATDPDRDNLTYYLDDAENNNKAACPGSGVEHANNPPSPPPVVVVPPNCDTYVRPISTAPGRDRLFPITACATAATLLAQEALSAACGPGGAGIRPACQVQVDALAACGCAAAAQTIIDEPCRNTLNPGQCQSAITNLFQCNL